MSKEITCTDLQENKYEVSTNQLSFRPAIYAIIIKNDKILLSKQWDGYDFPGGAIELGETNEEALKREVWEETGLKVRFSKVIDCKNSFFKLPEKDEFVHSILIYCICDFVGGEFSIDNIDEAEKGILDMPEWIDLDRIKDIKFHSSIDCVDVIEKAITL